MSDRKSLVSLVRYTSLVPCEGLSTVAESEDSDDFTSGDDTDDDEETSAERFTNFVNNFEASGVTYGVKLHLERRLSDPPPKQAGDSSVIYRCASKLIRVAMPGMLDLQSSLRFLTVR
ncbi:unnamed protein product [Notodromas monacha]|uniref:Uncharacterized protein n=1 Tax=Notodromas monacha TaxID=399045 RepID=A0A7R9BIB6_9CRUS|nr:unnamed protein product [Notodromas monacha]CAG0914958.1 unnamed protein product [Notodromas monacha]